MRLGTLIEKLEKMPLAATVWFKPVSDDVEKIERHPYDFASYRGYYDRLALSSSPYPVTVGELLSRARDADGATFTGWKGGDFTMNRSTLVHIGERGCTTDTRIVGVERDDEMGGVSILLAHVEDW